LSLSTFGVTQQLSDDPAITKHAPWYILRSDDKKRARLNCIHHILSLIPYKTAPRAKVKLPKRSMKGACDDQATLKGRRFVPEKY
jgi:polyphosphate kinase